MRVSDPTRSRPVGYLSSRLVGRWKCGGGSTGPRVGPFPDADGRGDGSGVGSLPPERAGANPVPSRRTDRPHG